MDADPSLRGSPLAIAFGLWCGPRGGARRDSSPSATRAVGGLTTRGSTEPFRYEEGLSSTTRSALVPSVVKPFVPMPRRLRNLGILRAQFYVIETAFRVRPQTFERWLHRFLDRGRTRLGNLPEVTREEAFCARSRGYGVRA